MKFLIVFVSTTILAAYSFSDNIEWVSFKEKHGKTYPTISEENYRFKVFKDNLRAIREHNARYENGEETFYMGVNKFTDQTPVEYRHMLNRQKTVLSKMERPKKVQPNKINDDEDGWDWRQWGAVLDVRNQGDCGSSWVFAVIGALEGQNAIVHGDNTTLLSAQQLIDCSVPFGAECQIGGEFEDGFFYAMNNGMETEKDYPFVGAQQTCRDDPSKVVFNIDSYGDGYSEWELGLYLHSVGPIAAMINADCMQHYEGGIFRNSSCPNTEYDVNFGVLVVGYNTTEDGTDYWIIKNSFGTDWGEKGYFRLNRGTSELGIGNYIMYPLVFM